MPRSTPGPVIGASPMRMLPSYSVSSPTISRSSVLLPQPLAPTMLRNSPGCTWMLTSLSALTAPVPNRNSLLRRSMFSAWPICVAMVSLLPLACLQVDVPLQETHFQLFDTDIDQQAGDADGDHPDQHDIRLGKLPRIHDQVTDPGGGRDEFGGDHTHPGDADADPHPGKNGRER